jgi:hypothetical protein
MFLTELSPFPSYVHPIYSLAYNIDRRDTNMWDIAMDISKIKYWWALNNFFYP